MTGRIAAVAIVAAGIGVPWAAATPAAAMPGAAMQDAAASDWRRVATASDRTRLRAWRSTWIGALEAARRDPAGAAAIMGDAALFDPDRALTDAMPPAGAYDCRLVKLGRAGSGATYAIQDWGRCRIDGGSGARRFESIDGGQRPSGLFHADTDARAVFLGSIAFADERPMAYGRDAGRDIAGLVERIGPKRWRLLLPRPADRSMLDLIDLRPEGQRPAAGNAGNVAR